jgi:hypothetical protein
MKTMEKSSKNQENGFPVPVFRHHIQNEDAYDENSKWIMLLQITNTYATASANNF